jgi:hypothetical protein
MREPRRQIFAILLAALFAVVQAAPAQQMSGSLEVNVKNVKVGGKPAKISRKRFYIFPGGLTENAPLVTRIKSAEITSRDCYYKGIQASDQYICWLQAENCESPFCRVVDANTLDQNDKAHFVPEFFAAYNKGVPLFKGKSDIARDWVLTNMPDNLVNGYYRQQQQVLATVLGGVKPFRSSMTDTPGIRTIILDIPFGASETRKKFLITNVLPVEIGGKSYVWTCEKDVEPGKKAIIDLSRASKTCEMTERELKVCVTAACQQQ